MKQLSLLFADGMARYVFIAGLPNGVWSSYSCKHADREGDDVDLSFFFSECTWRQSRILSARPSDLIGTFRSDYDYEDEYEFWAREAWVLAVVATVVAVVSSQQKYFSNFCEYEVITFCQSRECLVDKQHELPQSRQNIARQVARNISQCIPAFKD